MTREDKLMIILEAEPMLEDNINKLITAAYTLVNDGGKDQHKVECENLKLHEIFKEIGQIFVSYYKGGLD